MTMLISNTITHSSASNPLIQSEWSPKPFSLSARLLMSWPASPTTYCLNLYPIYAGLLSVLWTYHHHSCFMTSFTCYWFCLECTLNDLHTAHSFTSFKSQPRGHLMLTFPNFLPTVDPPSLTGYSLSHDLIVFSS